MVWLTMQSEILQPSKAKGSMEKATNIHNQTEDLRLIDVLTWTSQRKLPLFLFTFLSSLIAGIVSFMLPPVYHATAILQPVSQAGETGASLNRGNLSNLAGVVLGGSQAVDNTTVTMAYMRSNKVIRDFIEREGLLQHFFPQQWDDAQQKWRDQKPSLGTAVKIFNKRVVVTEGKDGLITLTVKWDDPLVAQKISEKFIARINQLRRDEALKTGEQNLVYLYARIKQEPLQELRGTISELVGKEMRTQMQAQGPNDYALKVIDPPFAPEFKSSPKEILNIILGAVFGLAFGVIALLIRQSTKAKI